MEIIVFALRSLLPILTPVAAGYLFRRLNWLGDKGCDELNRVVFYALLPLLIFMNLYGSPAELALPWRELRFALAILSLVFLLSWLLVPRLVRENGLRGMTIQGLYRSNFVLFGLPLGKLLLGGEGGGMTEMMIAVIIPIFNVLAVVALSYFKGEKPGPRELLGRIAANPLILACLSGLAFKGLKLELPALLLPSLRDLAQLATPLALIALGGQFYFREVKKYLPLLVPTLIFRLALIPAGALGLAWRLGFSKEAMVCFLALFASPIAVSSYSMAKQSCKDPDYAGQLLVYSTAFSALTLFAFISLGRQLAIL